MRKQVTTIPYRPRDQFKPFHDRATRYAVIVAHRRAGKTVACINELIKAALQCERPNPRFAYVAPLYKQAKDVAWQYLLDFTAPIPGREARVSELDVHLPNGGRVRLYGADNPDALRGIYLDGVVLDEFADMDPRIWTEVLRPALADRGGWAVFIGTPKGHNSFYGLWQRAQSDPDWLGVMLKASKTGIVAQAELDAARADMSEDQYNQEFECSFDAAIQGAYYGELMRKADEDERIASIPYEPTVKVTTAWDLGIGDTTAIWFCQQVGHEVRLIDFYETNGVGLDHYAKVLSEKPYVYDRHLLPHDAEVKELGTGKSRVETLRSLGITATIVPKLSVDDGINAARNLIPRCWFDAKKCGRGIEALKQYRREFDERFKAFKPRPLHDWSSHAADAFRYLAVGLKPPMKAKPVQLQQTKWIV